MDPRILLNQLWMKVAAHDLDAHDGLAASQTGLVTGCKRCSLLKLPPKRLMRRFRSTLDGQNETHPQAATTEGEEASGPTFR